MTRSINVDGLPKSIVIVMKQKLLQRYLIENFSSFQISFKYFSKRFFFIIVTSDSGDPSIPSTFLSNTSIHISPIKIN